MTLTKKQASDIARIINAMDCAKICFDYASQNNDSNRMFECNKKANLAIIELYDSHKIKLGTYDIAIEQLSKYN